MGIDELGGISGTEGGQGEEGSDRSVTGGRMGDGGMGCPGMQNEEIGKEIEKEWGKEEAKYGVAERGDCGRKKIEPKIVC